MSTAASEQQESSSLFLTLVRFRELSIIVFILLLIAVVAIDTPSFLSTDNFRNILLNISILVIVALVVLSFRPRPIAVTTAQVTRGPLKVTVEE